MSEPSSAVTASTTAPGDLRLRACRLLQFLGVLEIILFGLATFAVLRAAGMTIDQLQAITGANFTSEQLVIIHPQLRTFALILALSGLMPGAVLLICSMGLKKEMNVAAIIAIIVMGMQLFALGGILIRQLIVAIVQGEPSAMTTNVLALGTPMALLVLVISTLFRLRRAESQMSETVRVQTV